MNLAINNNQSFGQLVSTSLLLRAGSGTIKFEDAKLLNNELDIKISGCRSFYKRAIELAKKIAESDKNLAEIFEELKQTPKNQLDIKIQNYTTELGEKIDINV